MSSRDAAGKGLLARGAASEIRVLSDGGCPLCRREIRALRRLDRGRGRISFEHIAALGFDPSAYGLSYETLMSRIHGVLPDGTFIEGAEVFRRLYTALGLGGVVAPTRWPALRTLSEAAYRAFARNRLWLTGREKAACTPEPCGGPAQRRSPAA